MTMNNTAQAENITSRNKWLTRYALRCIPDKKAQLAPEAGRSKDTCGDAFFSLFTSHLLKRKAPADN
jgi:hypothetical protein